MNGRVGMPNPAAQIQEELSRLRAKGLSFDIAWRRALERVRWPDEKSARDEWKSILDRDVWEAAYSRAGESPKGISALKDLLRSDPSERQPLEVLA